jgi:hypothetical protein
VAAAVVSMMPAAATVGTDARSAVRKPPASMSHVSAGEIRGPAAERAPAHMAPTYATATAVTTAPTEVRAATPSTHVAAAPSASHVPCFGE